MTMETQTPTPSRPRKRWLIPTIIGAAMLLVGITVGVAVANSGDDTGRNGNLNATQLANVQRACQQWMGSYGVSAPSSDWCSNMASWMNDQWRSGQVMGSMMWGNTDRMRAACKRWAGASPSTSRSSTATNPAEWCDSMANWMDGHANGDRGGWMMGR